MTTNARTTAVFIPSRFTAMFAVLATLTVAAVILARWVLILRFGHETPFWDQWDSEIALLYLPYMNGELSLPQWIAPHNEHRILFTRLFNMGLFVLNDEQFDNYVETFANTIIYTLALLLCAWPVLRRLSGAAQLLAFGAVLVIGIAPFGWENLLNGFQNAFPFLGALSVAAFAAATLRRGNLALAAALALSLAALFTMASGLAAAAVLIVVVALRWRSGEVSASSALVAMAAAAAIIKLGLWLTPMSQPATPRSITVFADTLMSLLSWPLPQASLFGVLILWWPSAVTLWRRLATRVTGDGLDLYLLAICGWGVLQCIAIAYSREYPPNTVASRYTDILVLATLANIVLAVRLMDLASGAARRAATAALVATAVFAVGGFGVSVVRSSTDLFKFNAITQENELNLRAYLAGGQGAAAFSGKQPLHLSYPLPDRLISLLENPAVREMMPPSIRMPLTTPVEHCTGFERYGAYPTTPARPDTHGSFVTHVGNPSVGTCTSAIFTTRRPYLQFAFAGYLGKPGLSFKLSAADRVVDVVPAFEPRETWQPTTVVSPGTELRWIATDDNVEYWFAVAQPTEVGRLSMIVRRLMAKLSAVVEPVP